MSDTQTASKGYRRWVLFLLLALYVTNFIDRMILSILQEPIRLELGLADWQLGILGGASFAIFYTVLGLPIAWLADRYSRTRIIVGAAAVWSIMTGLCGLAQSYGQLLVARIGVGAGEAGGAPPAHALIAEYFPPEKRATALAIYSMGLPLGALIGAVGAGLIAHHWGWRVAFFAAAAPGIVLALLAQFTLREPKRTKAVVASAMSVMAVARYMAAKRSLVHIIIGSSLAAFAGYGISAFNGAYFMRRFALDVSEAGILVGLSTGIAAAVGILAGGIASDRAGRVDARWRMIVPALGLACAAPLFLVAYTMDQPVTAALVLILPSILQYMYLGPTYGALQNMAPPQARATAIALLSLVVNLIGLGLGPLAVGALSDFLARKVFVGGDFATVCAAAPSDPTCLAASAEGLRLSILAAILIFLWGAAHLALAARHIGRDMGQGDTSS